MTLNELMLIAREAREKSYSPYSKFQVGAAVLCSSGKVFSGANIENASYGLTVCAERVAIFNAISAGEKSFEALAVAGNGDLFPCGACLQVMAEFSPHLKVIISDMNLGYKEFTLDQLLPNAFSFK